MSTVPFIIGGVDYAAFSVPLTFPLGSMPGQMQCFNIQQFITDDIVVEMSENFRIMLSTTDVSAEFLPGRDCATINIMDNDRKSTTTKSIPQQYRHLVILILLSMIS